MSEIRHSKKIMISYGAGTLVTDFRQFVEENRKDQHVRELIAVYASNTGLSERTLKNYVKLLVNVKVYRRWRRRLLTPEEFEKVRRRNV